MAQPGGMTVAHSWRPRPSLVAVAGLVGLLSAACGSATNSLDPPQQVLGVADKPSVGSALVDGDGRTLYLFEQDPKDRSTCYGACASVWPPVTTDGPPTATGAVSADDLGTLTRDDGLVQVSYAGHPLYYYQADRGGEDAYGQGVEQFGAEWYAVTAQGDKAGDGGGGSGNGGGSGKGQGGY